MPKESIKGLSVKIGGDTSELGKALENVNKKSRDLSGELSSINRLLKLDPTNTELLTQKQKVLAEVIDTTEDKLKKLREAERQVQEQVKEGKVSEAQYRELQREIVATEQKLKGYKDSANTTAAALEHLGTEADQSADKIEEQEQKAEDAEEALDGLGDAAKESAEKIEQQEQKTEDAEEALGGLGNKASSVAKTGLTVLATAATAVVGSLAAAAEGSREYRTEMGKLNTSFSDNNHSAGEAYETYAELQSILGETDQAVEASNHLSSLCKTEKDLNDWTDILTGVYAKLGASLPVENLAETSNETAKTGKLTGGLADALNWAGVSEDEFQQALDECSSEQERQQLITKTLTKLYKGAATQYKKTNKEVIESNKATEQWNRSLAKVGKTVDPVLTDFKKLGAEILDSAAEPIEDLSNFITQKFIPGLRSVGSWVRENKAPITGTLTAVTVGLVAYKAAVLASEMQSKGLTGATLAQTAAQKALNLAMSASPTGLLIAGLAGLTAGIIAYAAASNDAAYGVDVLTDSEKELIDAAGKAADAFRDQQSTTAETMGGINSQMDHVKDLAGELFGLADASGKVKEADQDRVQYILNELNGTLGTEYELVGDTIQQYGELKDSIYDVIDAKTANSLIEAYNADYVAAMEAEGQAWEALQLAQEDYDAQLAHTEETKQKYADKMDEIEAQLAAASGSANHRLSQETALQKAKIEELIQAEEDALAKKKAALDQASTDYETYENTIQTYREAEEAAFTGNTQKAIDLLTEKGQAHSVYSDKVDDETAKVLDSLKREAVNAGIEAKRTKENFEQGVEGYTQEMVDEAEKGYQDAMNAFDEAYADAEGVGADIGDGLNQGMESRRYGLISKARSMVSGIIAAMRNEADSHSPARKLIDFGEDLGEGAEIGISNKTKDVVAAAKKQTDAVLDAYRAETPSNQQIFRSVAERQTAKQTSAALAASADNATMLGQILEAIKAGQVLTLDKKILVGGTAKDYDRELGFKRALVERGAV